MNDSDDNNVNDRSTETITADDFAIREPLENEAVSERRKTPEVDIFSTPEDAEKRIVQLMADGKYVDAVQTFRKLKTRWSHFSSEFVVGIPNIADDVWSLMNMYCIYLSSSESFFALTVADSILADQCGRLMTASMQVIKQSRKEY